MIHLGFSIKGDFEKKINIDNQKLDGMSISLTIDGYTDNTNVVFDGYAEVCLSGYDSCLPAVEVLSGVELTPDRSCSEGELQAIENININLKW